MEIIPSWQYNTLCFNCMGFIYFFLNSVMQSAQLGDESFHRTGNVD